MSVETITSVKNPLVASLRALKTAKARRETGLFLVEGETMLNEALSSGLTPRALLAEAETPLAARFPEARLVTRGVLEAVCDTKTPQGMCAAFELPPPRALSDAPQTLVALDGADFYQRPEVGERFVLVIGSEAHGISEEVRAQADALVKLPMRGRAESLNAAVAAGIMMYEMMRER